ncbi:MAG: ShlB/FhaC/HecB family hemolysin secretion/activation protein [Sphingomonas adhaesiva]|uniref:ShlB/FhaC/HecB family hemolysin secretion/activation protein n=1 Tax=Sphingomonas adhaesiva TaxID=28212 RepID=UPI002FFA77D2
MSLVAAALGTVAGTPLAAQQLQPPPPTREEVTPPPVAPVAPAPRVEVTGDIERAPCALADPAYAAVRVTITEAAFANLGPVTPQELLPAYRDLLGADRPVATICDIRDAAATVLRRKGYLAAIQVPVQKIENGRVAFEVIYGRLTAIRVRGDVGRAERLIEGYLSQLTRQPVFNRNEAERYLLLARDLPGYDVRLALRPAGTVPGELIGEVTVRRSVLDMDVNVQNYAAPDTGRWGGQLRAQFYGLTGMGDRTTVSLYSTAQTREQQILQLAHDVRLGSEGLGFAARYTRAWSRPSGIAAGRIRADTHFGTFEANFPFVRAERGNLRGAAGLDVVDQTVRFDGLALSRDRIRIAYLRVDGDATDVRTGPAPGWRGSYSLELRRGLAILHASRLDPASGVGLSRLDGDATATVIRGSAYAEMGLGRRVILTAAPRFQYAFSPLLSFEEFSGGTYTVGRGYDPGAIIGDEGVGLTVEARLARFAPLPNRNIVMQPFAFVDSARVWNRDRGGIDGSLVSIGGGVRAAVANRMRIDATLAAPLHRTALQTRRGPVRALLSITTRLGGL